MRTPKSKAARGDKTLPSLQAALPIQLLRARESVMAWFRPHLQAYSLTDHQWRVLRALDEAEALEMQELSTACQVHPPSLSRMIPKLIELDLIRREADPKDQRRMMTRLTPAGQALVTEVSKGSADIYLRITEAMGTVKLQALQADLVELIDRLDDAQSSRRAPVKSASKAA